MEPSRIHILGCGSALSTLKHNASSQVVDIRGKPFMVDCGGGTQVQLRRSRVSFTRIQAAFISHLHGDHCLGLIGMISTLGMLSRTVTLHVYTPCEFRWMLQMQMGMFCKGPEFGVVSHAVDTTQHQVIYEDKSLTVASIPLEHRVPCCEFLFREKPLLPHIRRDMIDCYQTPISQINNIKNGADWTMEEGKLVKNSRLTYPATAPRSYAYCNDTRYIPTLHQLVKGVDVLYHESTYDSEHGARAKLYYHSAAAQAAQVALSAGVGKLLLGHYNARYDDESVILREAQKIFPNSFLTVEETIFDVKWS